MSNAERDALRFAETFAEIDLDFNCEIDLVHSHYSQYVEWPEYTVPFVHGRTFTIYS